MSCKSDTDCLIKIEFLDKFVNGNYVSGDTTFERILDEFINDTHLCHTRATVRDESLDKYRNLHLYFSPRGELNLECCQSISHLADTRWFTKDEIKNYLKQRRRSQGLKYYIPMLIGKIKGCFK